MNTLKFYPKKLRDMYKKNIINSGIGVPFQKYHNSIFGLIIVISLASSTLFYFFKINLLYSLVIFVLLNIFFYFRTSLKASARVKKMENVFPDVISLMASNLRAGITTDRAFLLSARPEFYPLDREILKTGEEIATGKDIISAFKAMSKRIDSEKISKVITLIISGLKAGGNISYLLEETSRNMKQKEIIEKKAASTISMYVIFIFIAACIGAPLLFGLGSVLVEIVINLASKTPDLSVTQMDLPLTFSQVPISVNFIVYFSVLFIMITNFISSLVIGLVNKGEEKAGLKMVAPMLIISLTIFFIIRIILSRILISAISAV